MRVRVVSTVGAVLVSLSSLAAAWGEPVVVACPGSGNGGDLIDRGIYVTGYPGHTLGRVEIGYSASVAGTYLILLTAHRGAYNGPQLGETQGVTIDLPTSGENIAVFDFGGVPVTPGPAEIIAFTQAALGPGDVFFDTGNGFIGGGGPTCAGVFETDGTTPPLDTFRRHTVGLVISSFEPSTACVASDTVMCIDNNPGDQRFKVTVTFHTVQGGGFSGNGQEIPLAPLGVIHGGLFWFFGADNPEMLFKMVNGCGINSHFWVFISAGTNVAFTVTVFDTANGHTATYHNPDLNPAPPFQDVNALPCP
jgi:hypothetical protein